MRQYLKFDEKWKDWENVEMKWISHHNPECASCRSRSGLFCHTQHVPRRSLTMHTRLVRSCSLVVLDENGKEKERIDLQGLTAAKLESMLEARGFKRR